MGMNSWHSYPSIYNLGHRAITDLFSVPVNIEEKVDGSQFSFGVDEEGELHVRSKGAVMIVGAPEKMFQCAVDVVKELKPLLRPGWTYRAEYLQKPKHNSLAYDRIPEKHLILFDVNTGEESYLPFMQKFHEAKRLGLECVALLGSGQPTLADLRQVIDNTPSVLGGQKIEGVVIKPQEYNLFGQDKKVLMGKFVSERFKEIHAGEWKKTNPTRGDIVDSIVEAFKTDARWHKAVQHLREAGKLDNSPKDIGALIKEVQSDIQKECVDEVKERLYKFAMPIILRRVTGGLPEWYKEQLMKLQFEQPTEVGQ